jgi:hypothetical protein
MNGVNGTILNLYGLIRKIYITIGLFENNGHMLYMVFANEKNIKKILTKSLKKMQLRLEIPKKMYYYSNRGVFVEYKERYSNTSTISIIILL